MLSWLKKRASVRGREREKKREWKKIPKKKKDEDTIKVIASIKTNNFTV